MLLRREIARYITPSPALYHRRIHTEQGSVIMPRTFLTPTTPHICYYQPVQTASGALSVSIACKPNKGESRGLTRGGNTAQRCRRAYGRHLRQLCEGGP